MSTIISATDEEQADGQTTPAQRKRRWPLSFLLGGVIILAAVGYLIYANTQSNAVYDMTVSELRQCASCLGQAVRVEGTVQQGSIEHDDTMQQLTFVISDGKQSLPVAYSGVVPDIFNVGIQVVIEGRYTGQGTFQAQTLLTKCPSKFTVATPTP
jgi:cytochrome c-type biogenesis protein CcmE